MNRQVAYLLLLPLIVFNGCPEPQPTREIRFFSWIPDGSYLLAVVEDFGMPEYAEEIITFDRTGNEKGRVGMELGIDFDGVSDKLFFTQDKKSFFAQAGDNIYTVSTETGRSTLIVSNEVFFAASPSGKKIFTWLTRSASPHDSNEYSIRTLDMNNRTVSISKWKIPTSATFLPYSGYQYMTFLNDSVWASCFAQTGECSLTLFNDEFQILQSSNDMRGASLISHTANANELAYLSDSEFVVYNIQGKIKKSIGSVLPVVTYLAISPDGNFVIWGRNVSKGVSFYPSTLEVINTKTNEQRQLASELASSAQLSPDGNFVAYFTNNDRSIQLHILPVP